jgi:hypothetical protein
MTSAGRGGEAEAVALPADPSPMAGGSADATVTAAVRPWPLTGSIAGAATITVVATISGSTFGVTERRSGVSVSPLRTVPATTVEHSNPEKSITAATKPSPLNRPNPHLLSALRSPSSLSSVSAGDFTRLIAPAATTAARLATPV